ncbi:hypothetical protein B0H11DRAFT_707086 [Mycena galericulata]|nr:hypothetical protein B0H11DRAFT_707086 [Mycena galericulata]
MGSERCAAALSLICISPFLLFSFRFAFVWTSHSIVSPSSMLLILLSQPPSLCFPRPPHSPLLPLLVSTVFPFPSSLLATFSRVSTPHLRIPLPSPPFSSSSSLSPPRASHFETDVPSRPDVNVISLTMAAGGGVFGVWGAGYGVRGTR